MTGSAAATFGRSLEALAIRGHLISFGQASGPVGTWDIGAIAAKSVTVSRPNFGHYTTDPPELRAMADRLFDALRRRIIAPAVDRRLRLDGGFRRACAPRTRRKHRRDRADAVAAAAEAMARSA